MKLRNSCDNAPENYLNKYHLLEAELAAVQKNQTQALIHYEKAISLSNKNNFVHEEALACERAGIFHLEIESKEATANYYNHLLQNYPFLKNKVDHPSIKLHATGKELRVSHPLQDSVSLLTGDRDDESFVSLCEEQKRIRYSTNKKDGIE